MWALKFQLQNSKTQWISYVASSVVYRSSDIRTYILSERSLFRMAKFML